MKKVLTTILAFLGLLALGVTLGVDAGVNSKSLEITIDTFTEITASYTTTFTHNYSVKNFSEQDVTVSIEAYGVYKNNSGIQMNKGKNTYIKNTAAFPGAITNISLEWTQTGKNSPTLYAAKDEVASATSNKIAECSSDDREQSIDLGIENGYNYFYFDGTTVTGACYLSKFTITYSVEDADGTYYDVTFNSQNGEEPKTVETKENTLVSQPSDPTRKGYIFTGWYTDEECTEAWDFENDLVTGETNLYAGWEKDPYNYSNIDTETGNISGTYGNGVSHTLMDDETKDFDFVITDVMKNASRLQFKKDSGYLYNSTSVRGLIASIEIDFDSSEISVYTSNKPLTDSSSLTGGVVLSKDNPVYTLEDVQHSYFAIKNESGSVTYINNIKIQYTYEENFAETIDFINSETKASLKAEYNSELNPVNVDLRFGAKISLNAYNEDALYGVMVVAADEYANFASGATNYATADEFLAANTGVKKMECSEGALLADGYQFAWVITDMEGHYNTSLTAVIYMEYNGVLYLAICTTDSVSSVAEYYVDHSNDLGLTDEQTEVMMNIAVVED